MTQIPPFRINEKSLVELRQTMQRMRQSLGTHTHVLDELAAPTDVTTLNATTSAHGLLPKLGGGSTNFLRADGVWAAPGASPPSATTVEKDLGSTPAFTGKFTITDAAIGPTSKVMVWQAPGPYTGKGTLADEAAMQPVSVICVTPAAGSCVVHWQTPPIITMQRVVREGNVDPAVVGSGFNGRAQLPSELIPKRLGKVRKNVKFSYIIAA